jgi:hypothetical protein
MAAQDLDFVGEVFCASAREVPIVRVSDEGFEPPADK